MGRAMLSKSLIQFSVGGQGCVPSLLFDRRPNYGWGNEDNGLSNAEEAEAEGFCEDLQDLLEHPKKMSFSLQGTGMQK